MIHDLFSKRQRRQRGEFPDVYQYHTLPADLTKQLCILIQQTLGIPENDNSGLVTQVYHRILYALAQE
ncbi:hypothetical protein [Pseudomonas syringae group genomosp. 3]|uniref:hypothetical protein n=1 Tax=Pseudomonas syringae group genomosp. 3 TaxID=251701 RepID=UPI0011C41686|nr:hypothetical protein [Pseudomonas syringae group genomosp. 3]